MNLTELAHRLKRLRTDRGMTLEEVASKAGLTRGWLSKVENFRVTPSLAALSSLASVLGVSMAELFGGLDARPPIVVVRRDERRQTKRDEDVSRLTYYALAHPRPDREMDPFILEVPQDDTRPKLTHDGEEFMHVLSGSVDLEYDEQTYRLDEGDSAYIDGDRPHRLVCIGQTPAQVLVVYRDATAGKSAEADDGDA